jgi:hypothetical protein
MGTFHLLLPTRLANEFSAVRLNLLFSVVRTYLTMDP